MRSTVKQRRNGTDLPHIDAEMAASESPPAMSARLTPASCGSSEWRSDMTKPARTSICLWYNGDAEEGARFYARTFPDSSVGAVHRAPGVFPSGKKGDV